MNTLEDYKSYYENSTKEQILNDTYIDYVGYQNLAKEYSKVQKQNTELKERINKATNEIQKIIDAVNSNTIIAMKQFNLRLEVIQDELNGSNDILKEVE